MYIYIERCLNAVRKSCLGTYIILQLKLPNSFKLCTSPIIPCLLELWLPSPLPQFSTCTKSSYINKYTYIFIFIYIYIYSIFFKHVWHSSNHGHSSGSPGLRSILVHRLDILIMLHIPSHPDLLWVATLQCNSPHWHWRLGLAHEVLLHIVKATQDRLLTTQAFSVHRKVSQRGTTMLINVECWLSISMHYQCLSFDFNWLERISGACSQGSVWHLAHLGLQSMDGGCHVQALSQEEQELARKEEPK